MLDTSLDEQDHTHPMFAHAVMPRSPPGSPERKGSTSSTASASSTTPRLPPRPTQPSLAPSPTLTEFGQLQTAAKDKAVGYATYTPGFKRGVATMEVQRTPPALPPRSATVGQSERGKSREPPSVPKKLLKPAPPPRPTAAPRSTPDSAAKAFRFGSAAAESTSAQPAPPPRRSKPSAPGGTSLTPHPTQHDQHSQTQKERQQRVYEHQPERRGEQRVAAYARDRRARRCAVASARARASTHHTAPHRYRIHGYGGCGELAHRYGCIGATAVQSVHTVGGGCKVTCRRCAVQAVWPESQRQHAFGSERAAGPRGCGELDAHARRAARRCAQTCLCSRGAGMVEDAGSKRTRAIRCALYNHACRPGATPQACARGRKRVECIYTARKAAHGGRAGAARVVRVRRPTRGRYAHRRASGRVGCGERATRVEAQSASSAVPGAGVGLRRAAGRRCQAPLARAWPRGLRVRTRHNRCRARAQEVPPSATYCASQ
ncbi:hypothetical protein L1887_59625 [Cichorium endivia]|nr:hypothetical protein L1887_59625 [Cichorium endivia]